MSGASIVPIRPAKYAAVTNEEFLRGVFGEYYPYAHITAFPQPPDSLSDVTDRGVWIGGHYKDCAPDVVAGQNSYFTISLFAPDEGRAVRRKANFSASYLICIDDVGEGPTAKVHPMRLRDLRWPEPSYKLETSPGNEQWGYLFQAPCTNRALVSEIIKGLVASKLTADGKDPGMKGVTRYVRLPQGINNKTCYSPVWRVRLNEWNPARRFRVEDLAALLGLDANMPDRELLDAAAINAIDQLHEALGDWPEDPVLDALIDMGYWRASLGGKQMTICPNHEEHTDRVDEPVAYFRNGAGGKSGGLSCFHGHCEHITSRRDVARLLVRQYEQAGKVPPLALSDVAAGVQTYGVQVSGSPVVAQPVVQPMVAPPVEPPVTGEVLPPEQSVQALLMEVSAFNRTDPGAITRAREIMQMVGRLPAAEQRAFQHAFRASLGWTQRVWDETLREVRSGGDGPLPPALRAAFLDHVYVMAFDAFLNLRTRELYKPLAFSRGWEHVSDDVETLAFAEGGVRKVASVEFDPDQDLFFERDGQTYLNSWSGLVTRGVPGDIEPWLTHLKWLVPDKAQRNHLCDWLAFLLQYPGRKINHAVVMSGQPGVGKDTLFAPVVRALGVHAENVFGAELESDFNSYLERAKLVIFQEVDVGTRREAGKVANRLKPMISAPPDKLRVNRKGVPQYQIRNVVQAIFLTNEVESMAISHDDRRYLVLHVTRRVRDSENNQTPEARAYFEWLWQWMDGTGWLHVVDWLLTRDVSRFDPGAAPMVTEGKRALIERSRSDLGAMLNDMWMHEIGPFGADVVKAADVQDFLMSAGGHRSMIRHGFEKVPTLTALGKELARLWEPKEYGGRYRVYVVRNEARWMDASPLEAKAEVERGASMTGGSS